MLFYCICLFVYLLLFSFFLSFCPVFYLYISYFLSFFLFKGEVTCFKTASVWFCREKNKCFYGDKFKSLSWIILLSWIFKTFLFLYTIEAPRIRIVTGPFSKFFSNGNNSSKVTFWHHIFHNEATVGENCLTSVGWVTKYARTTI